MKYSEEFDKFYTMLQEINYTGPESLESLKSFIEGVIFIMDLKNPLSDRFKNTSDKYIECFNADLKIVNKAIARTSIEGKEDGFKEAKKELKTDLIHASADFQFHGF